MDTFEFAPDPHQPFGHGPVAGHWFDELALGHKHRGSPHFGHDPPSGQISSCAHVASPGGGGGGKGGAGGGADGHGVGLILGPRVTRPEHVPAFGLSLKG